MTPRRAVSRAWLAAAVPADLGPTGEEARRWVQEELARSEYRDGRSLMERLVQWFVDRFRDLGDATADGPGFGLPPLVTALLVALLLVALAWLLTTVRVEQRTVARRTTVLGGSTLTAAQFRERAGAALGQGRFGDALLDYTRALAREADNRTLLTDAPGLTAHEVGAQLAQVFPAERAAIARAMDLFDAVAYGGRPATREEAEALRSTDEWLRRARPLLRRPGTGAGPSAGGGQVAAFPGRGSS